VVWSNPQGNNADGRDLERVNRLYAVLSRVNEAILRIRDRQELLDAACKIAVEDGGLMLAWIGFLDAVSGRVSVAAKYGRDEGYLDGIEISLDPSVPEGQGPTAISLRECTPFVNNNTATNPFMAPWRDAQLKRGFASSASFPLIVDGAAIGVITLYAGEPGYFDDEEARLLTCLADDFSFALEAAEVAKEREAALSALQKSSDELEIRVEERTAQLREREQELQRLAEAEREAKERANKEAATTRALLEAANTLGGWTDVQKVLQQLASIITDTTGRKRVWVRLYDEQRKLFRTVLSVGSDKGPEVGDEIALKDMTGPAQETFARRRALVSDVDALPPEERGPFSKKFGLRCFVSAPMYHGDKPLGTIGVDDPDECHDFSAEEISLIEAIVAQAAVAVDNAQLLEERTEQARYADAVNRLNALVHSSLEMDDVMTRLVVEATRSLDVDSVAIVMRDGDTWNYLYQHGNERAQGIAVSTDEVLAFQTIAEERQPLIVDDIAQSGQGDLRFAEELGICSAATFPLIVRGEVVGGLVLANLGAPRVFHAAQVDAAGKLASTLALALENARLYETEHDIADRLQAALLALPDEVPGVEFSHAYHSATDTARVGGDFYDLFELTGDRVGVLIGDVAGKGLDAAVLTSMVKNTIRAHASERGKTPKQILTLTNEVIYKATPMHSFVTVFFGILDCRDGRLVYGNAGHTTAAALRGDGTVEALGVTGPLLGAFEDARFDQAETRLDLGTLLFLYTDGLTEARAEGELFGEKRVFATLRALRGPSPSRVVGGMIEAVVDFSSNRLRDDLAILALTRVASAAGTSRG
jgi:serine phosphatase RsbU (regulator of sigma subunit)